MQAWNGYSMYRKKIVLQWLFALNILYQVHLLLNLNSEVLLIKINILNNLDEYTRISTPRSDVLFKKGYLSRPKKNEIISSTQTMSPNDSATVSVVSSDDMSPLYRMHSISPENHSTPAYSTDRCVPDLPLMYSSGFYDSSGYFYVNRTYPTSGNNFRFNSICKKNLFCQFPAFVHNGFDQFNGQTVLMPYGSPPLLDPLEMSLTTNPSKSPPIIFEDEPVAYIEQDPVASVKVGFWDRLCPASKRVNPTQ